MNLWRKMTNFELGVRVPLLMRVPWKPASLGRKTARLVEAVRAPSSFEFPRPPLTPRHQPRLHFVPRQVSLYQTIAALAGLPPPSEQLEGHSFASAFDPTEGEANPSYAFSQFAKRNVTAKELPGHPSVPWDTCTKCECSQGDCTMIDVMGLSVRDNRWRYTEWFHWEKKKQAPAWRRPLVGVELYDHEDDLGSDFDKASATANLCFAAEYEQMRARLSQVLRQQFGDPWFRTEMVEFRGA